MDPELRRYLNGVLALLALDVAASFAAGSMSLGGALVLTAVFSSVVYAVVVDPDVLKRVAPPDDGRGDDTDDRDAPNGD